MVTWSKNSNSNSNIYSGVPEVSGDGKIKENSKKICVGKILFDMFWPLCTQKFEYFRKFSSWLSVTFFHFVTEVSPPLANGVVENFNDVPASLSTLVFLFDWLETLKTWIYYLNILASIHFLLIHLDTTSLCNTISQPVMKRTGDRKLRKLLNTPSPHPPSLISSGL